MNKSCCRHRRCNIPEEGVARSVYSIVCIQYQDRVHQVHRPSSMCRHSPAVLHSTVRPERLKCHQKDRPVVVIVIRHMSVHYRLHLLQHCHLQLPQQCHRSTVLEDQKRGTQFHPEERSHICVFQKLNAFRVKKTGSRHQIHKKKTRFAVMNASQFVTTVNTKMVQIYVKRCHSHVRFALPPATRISIILNKHKENNAANALRLPHHARLPYRLLDLGVYIMERSMIHRIPVQHCHVKGVTRIYQLNHHSVADAALANWTITIM